jgi:hypothetical protein
LQKQELQQSPQYLNIPAANLRPAINMAGILHNGVELLKLKSDNNKVLMVLFLQAMNQLFTVRMTHQSFWKAMLSHTDSYARQQTEGFQTWEGWFNNRFFCTVFLKILKNLHLTETDIDNLIKVLPPTMRFTAHLCQLSYYYMGLLDLWTTDINDPHCAFGAIGNKRGILEQPYDSFQEKCLLKLQGITIDTNNTRELFQAAMNQVLPGGIIIITGFKPNSISFGPMLMTASKSKLGAIQLIERRRSGSKWLCKSSIQMYFEGKVER